MSSSGSVSGNAPINHELMIPFEDHISQLQKRITTAALISIAFFISALMLGVNTISGGVFLAGSLYGFYRFIERGLEFHDLKVIEEKILANSSS